MFHRSQRRVFTDIQDSVNQLIRFQQPNLPDLEVHLHLHYPNLIADSEKNFTNVQNSLAACSCERLLLRKQVTAFKFSNVKFQCDMWKTLKSYLFQTRRDQSVGRRSM